LTPRRAVTVACLLSTMLAAPTSSFASDRPTVFVHGFSASASDWVDTAGRLREKAAIDPRLPNVAWRSEFDAQARELQEAAEFGALPDATVAVGHSNGGVVVREWSKLHRLGGIVTIGTPHGGAPILHNLLQWALFNDATRSLIGVVLNAFAVPTDWWWAVGAIDNYLRFASDFSLFSVVRLAALFGLETTAPVTSEMLPGSSYLVRLNDPANLEREAGAVGTRVGIASVARNYFWAGPARAIMPDQADAVAVSLYATAGGLAAFGSLILAHSSPADVAATQQGLSLIGLGFWIAMVDPMYCGLVSHPVVALCTPNDGVLPVDRQAYPGAANLWIEGPAHTQERQQSDDVLYHALVNLIGIPPRSGPAPSPSPTPPPDGGDPDGSGGGGDGNGDGSTRDPANTGESVTFDTGELLPSQTLHPGDTVNATSGRLHFTYQHDGNLVLYDENWAPLWASDTAGYSAGVVVMQADGNLVVYDEGGVPRWASGTYDYPGAWLAVQNDGNLVIYTDGIPVWASDTFIN